MREFRVVVADIKGFLDIYQKFSFLNSFGLNAPG